MNEIYMGNMQNKDVHSIKLKSILIDILSVLNLGNKNVLNICK